MDNIIKNSWYSRIKNAFELVSIAIPFVADCIAIASFIFPYIESPYVFTWEDGRPVVSDYVSHAFDKLSKRRGLRHICFHDLRHSCASILLSNGCNLKDVQDWLGHADVGMTANLYGHLDMSRKQELGRSMEQMLRSQGIRKSVR